MQAAGLPALVLASSAQAAGLGELQVQSALGQRFEARIELSGTADELAAARAAIAAHDAGSAADTGLGHFEARVRSDGDGHAWIQLSSRNRVAEPMLSLVVELQAGDGVLRRAYDVLLDPPTSQGSGRDGDARSTGADAISAAAARADSATVAAHPRGDAAASPRHHDTVPAPAAGAGRYGPIVAGETLGSIAEAVRERVGGRFTERVAALRRLNPQGFEPGHRDWPRVGGVWQLPAQLGAVPVVGYTAGASASRSSSLTAEGRLPGPLPEAGPLASPIAVSRFRFSDRLGAVGAGGVAPPNPQKLPVAIPTPLATAPPRLAPVLAPGRLPAAAGAGIAGWRWPWWALLGLGLLAGYLLGRLRAPRRLTTTPASDDALEALPMATHVHGVGAAGREAAAPPLPVRAAAPSRPSKPAAPVPTAQTDPAVAALLAPMAAMDPPPSSVPPTAQAEHPAATPGFHHEVSLLLLDALAREPGRLDLRFKLLEVYHEASSEFLFKEQARLYLRTLGGRDDPHWPRIQAMGRDLDPDSALFDGDTRGTLDLAQRPLRFYEHDLPGTLHAELKRLADDYQALHVDAAFRDELLLSLAMVRPPATPLLRLDPRSAAAATQVWCKWDSVDAVGASARVNAYAQAFLAQTLGRDTVVTATRTGRHGLAVAAAAAQFGLVCRVHMTVADHLQDREVAREMHRLGAELVMTDDGVSGDARTAALRDWLGEPRGRLYVSSLAAGPHPYPSLVRDFQGLLGTETKAEILEKFGRRPLAVIVARSDGAPGISVLQAFLDERDVDLYCVEAHGARPEAYRREHSWLQHTGRVNYVRVEAGDGEALVECIDASEFGRPPASSLRAAAFAERLAQQSPASGQIVVLMRRGPVDLLQPLSLPELELALPSGLLLELPSEPEPEAPATPGTVSLPLAATGAPSSSTSLPTPPTLTPGAGLDADGARPAGRRRRRSTRTFKAGR